VRPERVGFHVSAFGSDNLLAALSSCARHGFAGLEIFADTSVVFADRPEEFRAILDIAGVDLAGVHCGGQLTAPEFHEAEVAEWTRMLAWIKAVGGDYAVYCGGERALDPTADLEHAASLLNEIGRVAQATGVTLCYQPDQRSPFRTRQSLARLLEETDPALVKLCVDTAHLARTEIDPGAFLATHGKRLHVVHVRDLRKPDTPDISRDGYVDPGRGVVDLAGVSTALLAAGFEGWVVGVVGRPHVTAHRSVEQTAVCFRSTLGLALA
jgi:inosose dehydratase